MHWTARAHDHDMFGAAERGQARQQESDSNQIYILANQTGTSMFSSTTRPSNK